MSKTISYLPVPVSSDLMGFITVYGTKFSSFFSIRVTTRTAMLCIFIVENSWRNGKMSYDLHLFDFVVCLKKLNSNKNLRHYFFKKVKLKLCQLLHRAMFSALLNDNMSVQFITRTFPSVVIEKPSST